MIKSGVVIQNRYLGFTYPSDHNPHGRPGNLDVARPYDSSSVFDKGVPKDVSPYQPRVAETVEFIPRSVFKPRKLQRQLKEINKEKWGQTVLTTLFGAGEDQATNYLGQRLIGIVDNVSDSRMDQSMMLDNPLLQHRGAGISSTQQTSTQSSSTSISDDPMPEESASNQNLNLPNIFDLSLGEGPLNINIPEEPSGDSTLVQLDVMGEVETNPLEAAKAGGLLDILQVTEAGPAFITPRKRLGSVDEDPRKKVDFGM